MRTNSRTKIYGYSLRTWPYLLHLHQKQNLDKKCMMGGRDIQTWLNEHTQQSITLLLAKQIENPHKQLHCCIPYIYARASRGEGGYTGNLRYYTRKMKTNSWVSAPSPYVVTHGGTRTSSPPLSTNLRRMPSPPPSSSNMITARGQGHIVRVVGDSNAALEWLIQSKARSGILSVGSSSEGHVRSPYTHFCSSSLTIWRYLCWASGTSGYSCRSGIWNGPMYTSAVLPSSLVLHSHENI